MKQFTIRGQKSGLYVDNDRGFHYDPANAMIFPTQEAAAAHLKQRVIFPSGFQVCERTEDGSETPVA
jgi:hypothetical protein